jgi:putative radical SAM enzyme (TIGR03279 family)
MRPKSCVEIESILRDSPAEKAGLRQADKILSINSHRLRDAIDFMFFRGSEELTVEFVRGSNRSRVQISAGEGEDLGITLKPFKVKTCRNNCVFCFVKQLPRGLRKPLYIKDEDYRLSFLHGNYMTLSNIEPKDRKRIVEQRLSPLYLSVHATNRALRNKMLGNPKAQDIMKELKFFAGHKIRMHTQIVLCPGYNDGEELRRTIRDLYKFYPYVSSVAVVPVGLTMHRKHQISPVTKEDALRAIRTIEPFQKRFRKKHGDAVVYCSDEMYVKADIPFPGLKDYGSFPQIENGVGMVPLFLSQARKIRIPKTLPLCGRYLSFTGTSFYPFLRKFADRLAEKEQITLDVIPVENNFFGTTVTVAGLLTGRDVMKSLHDNTDSYDALLVPDVALKEDEDLFLDDVSLKEIEEVTGLKTVRIESTPQGIIDAIERLSAAESGQ